MIKKRALDIVITGLAAVIWIPVLSLAALAVLVLSGRPVLYRSMRRTSTEDVLRIVKFRTMVKNAEALVNRSTVPIQNDVRFLNIAPDSPLYTGIGRFLERCGLTEIPQLMHVLRGQMSIVGNRPLPENVVAALREEYPTADDRFLTKSGLTGPAQLVGRSALTDLERLTLEGAYCRACVRRYSIWLDVSILLATVMIVIGIKKAYTYQGVLDLIDRRSRSSRRTLVKVVTEADESIATEAV
jgi:lipopolysaccharide/colanic/teichoic acid biosynthesis glycosyltransferase